MADDDGRSDPPAARADLDAGLRSAYTLATRQRADFVRLEATIEALMAALIEAGAITDEAIDDQLAHATRVARSRVREHLDVQLHDPIDKYGIPDPGIDCDALMPLCHGRCCKMSFPLSAQDLDEGVVRWRYDQPYVIRQRADGYCAHNDPATHGCGVYQHRPATCRSYDCRRDPRVWLDWDNKVPAPLARVESKPIEITIKRRKPA
ncbi:MAG: YkgJ family cysteine cluster protein [Myxococcales bacterium]|nr:YkgJ family cysteine cluster protein [Myxococcales bacterium]